MLERLDLSMPLHLAVGHGDDVGVVHFAVGGPFDQARADGHAMLAREREQALCGGTGGYFFGQDNELLLSLPAEEPIAGQAALGEDEDLDALSFGIAGEALDLGEIGGLIAGGVFKLHRCYADVGHDGE